jgi:hypothetical protein
MDAAVAGVENGTAQELFLAASTKAGIQQQEARSAVLNGPLLPGDEANEGTAEGAVGDVEFLPKANGQEQQQQQHTQDVQGPQQQQQLQAGALGEEEQQQQHVHQQHQKGNVKMQQEPKQDSAAPGPVEVQQQHGHDLVQQQQQQQQVGTVEDQTPSAAEAATGVAASGLEEASCSLVEEGSDMIVPTGTATAATYDSTAAVSSELDGTDDVVEEPAADAEVAGTAVAGYEASASHAELALAADVPALASATSNVEAAATAAGGDDGGGGRSDGGVGAEMLSAERGSSFGAELATSQGPQPTPLPEQQHQQGEMVEVERSFEDALAPEAAPGAVSAADGSHLEATGVTVAAVGSINSSEGFEKWAPGEVPGIIPGTVDLLGLEEHKAQDSALENGAAAAARQASSSIELLGSGGSHILEQLQQLEDAGSFGAAGAATTAIEESSSGGEEASSGPDFSEPEELEEVGMLAPAATAPAGAAVVYDGIGEEVDLLGLCLPSSDAPATSISLEESTVAEKPAAAVIKSGTIDDVGARVGDGSLLAVGLGHESAIAATTDGTNEAAASPAAAAVPAVPAATLEPALQASSAVGASPDGIDGLANYCSLGPSGGDGLQQEARASGIPSLQAMAAAAGGGEAPGAAPDHWSSSSPGEALEDGLLSQQQEPQPAPALGESSITAQASSSAVLVSSIEVPIPVLGKAQSSSAGDLLGYEEAEGVLAAGPAAETSSSSDLLGLDGREKGRLEEGLPYAAQGQLIASSSSSGLPGLKGLGMAAEEGTAAAHAFAGCAVPNGVGTSGGGIDLLWGMEADQVTPAGAGADETAAPALSEQTVAATAELGQSFVAAEQPSSSKRFMGSRDDNLLECSGSEFSGPQPPQEQTTEPSKVVGDVQGSSQQGLAPDDDSAAPEHSGVRGGEVLSEGTSEVHQQAAVTAVAGDGGNSARQQRDGGAAAGVSAPVVHHTPSWDPLNAALEPVQAAAVEDHSRVGRKSSGGG